MFRIDVADLQSATHLHTTFHPLRHHGNNPFVAGFAFQKIKIKFLRGKHADGHSDQGVFQGMVVLDAPVDKQVFFFAGQGVEFGVPAPGIVREPEQVNFVLEFKDGPEALVLETFYGGIGSGRRDGQGRPDCCFVSHGSLLSQ